MLVATAGHCGHGKTTLVRALTGVNTDRLPEEKARGRSIDIGFAYWTTSMGRLVGFVDVPGHERHVRSMLVGVAGVDFALLVVAADEGVMPQTREHLQILDLLDVRAGLVVVSKADRVGADRLAEVSAQTVALMAGTSLAGSTVLTVSANTGVGMSALRAALEGAARSGRERGWQDRNLRYGIDRAFTVPGTGTVVTGTVVHGRVASGDELRLSPSGLLVQVQTVHKQGQTAEQAVAGERCALNIAGAGPKEAGRGNWLLAPRAHAPTTRVETRLRALPTETQPLAHWQPVHVHIGTAEVMGRLVMPRQSVAPGATGFVQIALESPLAIIHGDHFVIRDQSARRTLGGGVVLDPFGTPTGRERVARAARLVALDVPSPGESLAALLHASPEGVDVEVFRRTFNLAPATMQSLLEEAGAVSPEGERTRAFSRAHLAALEEALLKALERQRASSPKVTDADLDALCRAAAPHVPARVRLAAMRAVAQRDEPGLQLPRHLPTPRRDERLWQRLEPMYREWGPKVPQLREIALRAGVPEGPLRALLKHRAATGDMVCVSPERYCLRSTAAFLAERAVALGRASKDGQFTVGDFRDFTGVGRNLSIEILELFDRLGITSRTGNARVIRNADHDLAPTLEADPRRSDHAPI